MQKVLITPKSYHHYKEEAYRLLAEHGYEPVENRTGRTLHGDEIVALVGQDVVGVIVGVDPLPGEVLERLGSVRAISKYGMGVDNIDTARAGELGIAVKAALGTNNCSVAELAIGLMFSLSRHIPAMADGVRAGGWERVLGYELTGKRLGLVGGGQIGQEVAKRALGLQMRVSIYDPYMSESVLAALPGAECAASPDQLFAEADYISLHVPALPETHHLVNGEAIGRMKRGAFLINTSRGELVDEEALYEALKDGRLGGAASDVFSMEPPPPDHKLLALPNFLLTPHTGAYTYEAIQKMVMRSTENLIDMLATP